MKFILKTKATVFVLVLLLSMACHTTGNTSTDDSSAASLLYSAYGSTFTPVPTGGCSDSTISSYAISVGGTTTFTGLSYYYYFFLFTGNGSSNTFNVTFTTGEADLWIGSEDVSLIPTDFSGVEFRSENVGTESYSGVSTTNGSTRCLVVPVTNAGSFTLSVN
ncbi:hypothetical protein EHQ53_03770 [Leptospira langatensis]|uniref:Peptidase A1 domain-containing protein n=1 Tax=Leptospira langatensis TaxID=2484983 RepID=A0A5F2A0G8_9LEPT|nr:hypothetical protein [Leptospira langatensis]TGK04277.1 hypothetical protein EHO57_04000 [Leptospira langatensis]TGL43757.1 hypothetical protein EHQ53_03770 [Leptospira langatensis]